MTKRLRTVHYAVSVAVIAAALVFGGNLSGQLPSSFEVGFSSFSPRGAAGGAVIPASCESGFEHVPGECAPSAMDLDLKVNGSDGPLSMAEPASYVVAWTSVNVDSCTASGAWSGSKPVNGSENEAGVLAGSYTYTINCSGPGPISDSVTVNVEAAPSTRYS